MSQKESVSAEDSDYASERANLHSSLWKVANELRGTIDGWDFKNCTLSILTYIHLSSKFSEWVEGRGAIQGRYHESTQSLPDEWKQEAFEEFGFFLEPEHTYERVVSEGSGTYQALKNAFNAIQHPSIESLEEHGASDGTYKGLFNSGVDFFARMAEEEGLGSESLSNRLKDIMMALHGTVAQGSVDNFGDAYEFLMNMYASDAGKSGGEYFTPQSVSSVLTRIASAQNPAFSASDVEGGEIPQDEPIRVYDPTCGSGSLLLNFSRTNGRSIRYYGQEKSNTTYNFARMNMLMHGIDYHGFSIAHGDTLVNPKPHDGISFRDQEGMFDAIVSNPPYSINWDCRQIPQDDPRFTHGIPPATRADLAFTQHILYSLKDTGTAAIIEFPGILYRSGVERDIRKSLIEANVVDAVIRLSEGVFYGTSIPTCILVLKKNRVPGQDILFINASLLREKQGSSNILTREHQDAIVEGYVSREETKNFSRRVSPEEIQDNNYDLSPENYVSPFRESRADSIERLGSELEELSLEQSRLMSLLNKAKESLVG